MAFFFAIPPVFRCFVRKNSRLKTQNSEKQGGWQSKNIQISFFVM